MAAKTLASRPFGSCFPFVKVSPLAARLRGAVPVRTRVDTGATRTGRFAAWSGFPSGYEFHSSVGGLAFFGCGAAAAVGPPGAPAVPAAATTQIASR
jgi:hypothetical protein